jgi:hypothetical protein
MTYAGLSSQSLRQDTSNNRRGLEGERKATTLERTADTFGRDSDKIQDVVPSSLPAQSFHLYLEF